MLIGDFNAAAFQPEESFFLRIGGGSLGGKARGLAFICHFLHQRRMTQKFAGVRISVPPTLVLATDIFDSFLVENTLHDFAIQCDDDEKIVQRFLAARLPASLIDQLLAFLSQVRYPLAVRSSELAGRLAVSAFRRSV